MQFTAKNNEGFKNELEQVCLELRIDFPHEYQFKKVANVYVINLGDSFASKLTTETILRLGRH